MAQEVVVLDSNNVEHVFPEGFDPSRAAAIVRAGEKSPIRSVNTRPTEPPKESAGMMSDLMTGVAKGAANTVTGLGTLAYDYIPGVRMASDAVQRAAFGDVIPGNQMMRGAQEGLLKPDNTTQKVGFTAEQLGEFFIPASKAGVLAKVPGVTRIIPAAQAALTTAAQGGSATDAGVSGGLSAVFPGGATLRRGAAALEAGAEKNIAQALGATTRDLKKDAAEIAPQVIRRGVRGSREAMLERATQQVEDVGAKIGAEVSRAAAAGGTVNQQIIRGNIQLAKDKLMETMASGKREVVPGYEQVVQQLDALDEYVSKLPADIPVDQAHRLKMRWDGIVDAAGLFGSRGMTSAADKSRASAFESASDAFREMLNGNNVTLADLNREFQFWKRLQGITKATVARTQSQTGGLIRAGAATAGAASGFASGDSLGDSLEKGAIGGVLGSQLVKVIQSPAWRTTVTAPLKQKLADALASGNAERVASIVGKITAAMPAQFTR